MVLILVISIRGIALSVLHVFFSVGSPIKCIIFHLKGCPSFDQQFSDPFQRVISLIFFDKPLESLRFPFADRTQSLLCQVPCHLKYHWDTPLIFQLVEDFVQCFTENCCSGVFLLMGLPSKPLCLFGSRRFRTLWCSLDLSNNDAFWSHRTFPLFSKECKQFLLG